MKPHYKAIPRAVASLTAKYFSRPVIHLCVVYKGPTALYCMQIVYHLRQVLFGGQKARVGFETAVVAVGDLLFGVNPLQQRDAGRGFEGERFGSPHLPIDPRSLN